MSDFYNKYPYTDFHELNLDWVIERVKKLTEDWLATQQEWNDTEEQWQQLYDYVHDYFANLDVQDEINNKINQMILDGTFMTIVTPTINQTVVDATTTWLAAHITQPTTPAIDNTLSIAGAAADAKAAGDQIRANKSVLDNFSGSNQNLNTGDLNTFTASGIYAFAGGNIGDVPNAPLYPVTGSLFVMNNSVGNIITQVIAYNNAIYYRSNQGSWSAWIRLYTNTEKNMIAGVNNVSSADLDTFTTPSIYSFAGNLNISQVQNAPEYPFNGVVVSMFGSSNVGIQYAILANSNAYIRIYYGSFGAWIKVDLQNNITIGSNNISSADLNTYTTNSINSFAGNLDSTQVQNAPEYPFNGVVITHFASLNVGCQIVIMGDHTNMYIRSYYSTWRSWKSITEIAVRYPYAQYRLFDCFLNVGVIGDSLASGTVGDGDGELPENLHDVYSISWGQFMARMTGNTYYNFSNRGLTTKSWLASSWLSDMQDPTKKCDAYFIGLGVNDAYDTTYPVGTSADVHPDDYTLNAESFYGYYGKIISLIKLQVPDAKIFVFTAPREIGSPRYVPYNAAIEDMANIFTNVYVIDLASEYVSYFTSGIIPAGYREGHYDAVAYQQIAMLIYDICNKIMVENINDFLKIELINEYGKYS